MKHLLAAFIALTAASSLQTEDLFSRVARDNKAFWHRGEKALWLPSKTIRTEVSETIDDDEDDPEGDEEPATHLEADYQRDLCLGMRQEVRMPSGGRVDCLSTTHAIEVEFSEKWAEGLGQALSYVGATGLKPGIFLVCREAPKACLGHRLRLEEAIAAWKLPVDVWAHDE